MGRAERKGAPVRRAGAWCLAAAVLLVAGGARAEGAAAERGGGEGAPAEGGGAPLAFGVELDLLPTVASAVDGELGGALQLWAGRGRHRLRLVGAGFHYPDALTDAPFADHRSTVAALLYDRFFRDGFRGPWVAAGVEYWWSSIGLEGGSERGSWSTPVVTAGAGWVFPVWRGLYLNPWGAVHLPLDTGAVKVGDATYHPRAVEAEISLKVGWAFSGFPAP